MLARTHANKHARTHSHTHASTHALFLRHKFVKHSGGYCAASAAMQHNWDNTALYTSIRLFRGILGPHIHIFQKDWNATLPSVHRVCTVLQSEYPSVSLDRYFYFPRSMPPSLYVSNVFARSMLTLSVFVSLTKMFQLVN